MSQVLTIPSTKQPSWSILSIGKHTIKEEINIESDWLQISVHISTQIRYHTWFSKLLSFTLSYIKGTFTLQYRSIFVISFDLQGDLEQHAEAAFSSLYCVSFLQKLRPLLLLYTSVAWLHFESRWPSEPLQGHILVSSVCQACLSPGDAHGNSVQCTVSAPSAHSDQKDHNNLGCLLVTSKQVHTDISKQGSQGVWSVLVLSPPSLWIHYELTAISFLN